MQHIISCIRCGFSFFGRYPASQCPSCHLCMQMDGNGVLRAHNPFANELSARKGTARLLETKRG